MLGKHKKLSLTWDFTRENWPTQTKVVEARNWGQEWSKSINKNQSKRGHWEVIKDFQKAETFFFFLNWPDFGNLQVSRMLFQKAWQQAGYLINFIMHLKGREI